MAPSKKSPASSKTRSSSSSQPHIKKVKGENFYHNAKTVGRLKMLNGGKPVRDKDGKIISHTIEHVDQNDDWDKGVGARVVGLTDWLLGNLKGRPGEPGGAFPVFEMIDRKRRESV